MTRMRPGLKQYPVETRYGRVFCDVGESVCYPLMKYGEYPHWRDEEEEYAALPLSANSVVLDVGANIGVTVRMFAQRAGHVHAFEPAPRAVALLTANTRDLPNVTVYPVALADKAGTMMFNERVELDSSRLSPGEGGVGVQVSSVDEMNLKPDLIKIDVEGFEHLVLKGATKTLREGPIVIFEALSEIAREYCEEIILRANHSYKVRQMGSGSNYLAMIV